MKTHYKLTAIPTFATEQFSGCLVTFVAINNIKARRTWTVYRSDLVGLFHQILTRVEAEKIVSDLRKGIMINFADTFTPGQLRPLGFLELDRRMGR